MSLLRIICTGVLILFVYNETYSQVNNKVKTYFTADSLSFIYLLPNNEFGYMSYQGESPLSYYNDKNQIKGHIDGPYFILQEKGSGKYMIKENELTLNFVKPKHPVDSVFQEFLDSPQYDDSLTVKIIIKPYLTDSFPFNQIGIGTKITSKDGTIDLNTMFENQVKFKVGKNQIPLKLVVNRNYYLTISKNTNQVIELYFNRFKKMTTDNIKNKIFDIDKLIQVRKE